MGRKKTEEFNDAYDMYCNTELTQKQIAKIVGVSEVQLSKWAKENDWDLDRTTKQATVEKLIRDLYINIADIQKAAKKDGRVLDSAETDQIIKLTNSIQTLRKKYNLSAYHSVLRECLEWMMKADNEKAKSFGPLMLEFLKEKAQQLSNGESIG